MLFVLSLRVSSQEIYRQTVVELEDTLCGEMSYLCQATSSIELSPGFNYKPESGKDMVLEIDRYSIFPPENDICGGNVDGDDGVVASVPATFEVGNTGAAVYTVDIKLPQAIGEMIPKLALVYNNQSGNGTLGWAWNLQGLSSIERVGMTEYHDGKTKGVDFVDDGYALDGQRLMSVGNGLYKTEIDNMDKIMSYMGSKQGPDYFLVWKNDGTIWEYGATEDSKIEPQGNENVVFRWLLNKISDRSGNSINYRYYENKSTGEVYIRNIEYTSNERANVKPAYNVVFQYEQKVSDVKTSYVYGNMVVDTKLLKKIEVFSNCSGKKIIEYLLSYDAPGYYGSNYYLHYRLNSVQMITDSEKVNPIRILWNSGKHHPNNTNAYKKYELDKSVFNKATFVGDFNGDGFSDVLLIPYKISDKYDNDVEGEVYVNNGNGTFQKKPMTKVSFDKNLDWIYVVDIDGDGVDDIVPYELHYDSDKNKNMTKISMCLMSDGTFVNKKTIQYEGRVILLSGCFVKKGEAGIVIIDTYDGHKNKENARYLRYRNGNFINSYIENSNVINGKNNNCIAVDISGDGIGELLSLNEDGYKIYRIDDAGILNLDFVCEGVSMTNEIYPFPNDYNGDGKMDVLYYNSSRFWNIVMSEGDGFSEPMSCTNNNLLRTVMLNSKDRYRYSLKEMEEPTVTIRTADFDGDGIADVGVFKNTGGNYYLEIGFAPYRKSDDTYAFSTQRRYYMPINYSHQTIQLGRFLPQENISVLSGLPMKPMGAEKAYITSLYPNSTYYSVERIIDGMGNSMGFSYEYLIQKKYVKNDFYTCSEDVLNNNIERKSVPVLALKTDTVYNVNGKPVVRKYNYHNALVHKYGHGFLGFEKIITRTYLDGNLEQKQIREFETTTTGVNCLSLPYCVKLYHGENQLVKERYFRYKKYYCKSNNRVIMPLLLNDQEIIYDVDKKDIPVKNIIVKNVYNADILSKNSYDEIIQLTSARKGFDVSAAITDPTKCSYWEETCVMYNNDIKKWVVNRPEKVVSCSYDKSGNVVGNVMLFEYDVLNPFRISREIKIPNIYLDMNDSLLVETRYKYDKVGNVIEQTLSSPSLKSEKKLKFEYGEKYQCRYKTKLIDELGRTSIYEYDPDYGILKSTKDYNGLITNVNKDPLGVKDVIEMPDGMKVIKQLCWASNNKYAPSNATFYLWEKSLGKAETMVFYHKSGAELRNVTFDINGSAIFVDKIYDDYGNVKQESLPYYENGDKLFVSNVYDEYNRLTDTYYPNGMNTHYMYDGNVISSEISMDESVKRFKKDEYNVMGWLVKTTDDGGNEIEYEYYSDGLLESAQICGNEKSRVSVTYDNCRNRSSLYDPNFGLVSYTNDALGNIRKIVDAQSVVEFEYDVSGRMVSRLEKDIVRNKENMVQWVYCQDEGRTGLLSKIITSDNHCVDYRYDDKLRLVSRTESVKGVKYLSSYSYDEANRISTMTYPSGVRISKSYSNTGYEKMVCDAKTNELLWKTVCTNADGYVTEYIVGNGLRTKCLYDPATNLIEHIKTSKDGVILQNLSYEYDGAGNLKNRCDLKWGNREDFEYDSYDRLVKIVLNGEEFGRMVYDNMGNIQEKEMDAVRVLYNAVYDRCKPNAIVRAQTDDANLYDKSRHNIQYSPFDNVVAINSKGRSLSIEYGFDHERKYMECRSGDDLKIKTYVGNCEFVEENGKKKVYTYLDGPIGVFAVCVNDGQETVNYIHKDHLESWNIITDKTGELLAEMSFDAWGNSRDPKSWNEIIADDKLLYDRGFTGHEHLSDFGLINMNGRMYDPLMSLMLSPDNNIQMLQSSQNFNRYSYCLNNPLKYNDPTGEWVESLVFGVVGGCANVVMNARNIDTFGEGALLFGVGFVQGFLTEYTLGQSWLLQVGVGTLTSGVTSGVNQMVSISDGGLKFSGDEWNSIKTATFYGLGSGLVKSFMYSYINPPTDDLYGDKLIDFCPNQEIARSMTALAAHGAGCWFSGRPFLETMGFKDVGFDLGMLGCIANRLFRKYVVKSGFADKVMKQRAEEIKNDMLETILMERSDITDIEYTYQLQGTWMDKGRLYIIGDVFSFFPGVIFESFPKPYLDEVISMPFNYSLFRTLFFNKQ